MEILLKKKKLMPSAIKRRSDIIAVLAALSIFLSTIEYIIPKPLPFLRLGIANFPVLISIMILKPKETMQLIIFKVAGQGLINGMLFSHIFILSCAGGIISGIIMLLARFFFKDKISLIGISILGAISSNLIQIVISVKWFLGEGAWVIAPPLLIIGTVSGGLLGIFSEKFYGTSEWIKTI